MAKNKSKYLLILATFLLVCNSISFTIACDTEESTEESTIEQTNKDKQINLLGRKIFRVVKDKNKKRNNYNSHSINNNINDNNSNNKQDIRNRIGQIKQKLLNDPNIKINDENWNIKNIGIKMRMAHEQYIKTIYPVIQKQLIITDYTVKKFEQCLLNIMKYSKNNEMERLIDTIQIIYDKINEYNNLVNNISQNETISNEELELLYEINILIQDNFSQIKDFINEQEEKLSVIQYTIKDTNYKEMSLEERIKLAELHKKHASAAADFIKRCYYYNNSDDTFKNGNSYVNYNDSPDIESNLNIGEIDNTSLIPMEIDSYSEDEIKAKISNNEKRIIESYENLINSGKNLINDVNTLQTKLNNLSNAVYALQKLKLNNSTNNPISNNQMEIE